MLKKLENLPGHVAGLVAMADVDKDDYQKILIPELERPDKQHGHIHFILVLETSVKNFSAGAWMEDAWMGLKHYRGWRKVAIVTDESAVETFTDKFSAFLPGAIKRF